MSGPLPTVLAVDIGGTKMDVGVVGGDGAPGARARAATPPGADGEEVWGQLAALIDEVGAQGATCCGIGIGGPMALHGRDVSPLNIPGWRAFPLGQRVAARTGLATWVDNDAKALALAEGRFGAAVGCDDYLSMVVSSGVGGGIVLDGRLLDGSGGNAGHIGHLVVEPEGRRCVCGARGCLEAEASGMSIAKFSGAPAALAGPELVARTGRLVGRAVASVSNLLDLGLTTVAGSVALGFGQPFFAAAQAELDALCRLEFSTGARIVASGLGADGPLVGAACVGWRGAGHLGPGASAPVAGPASGCD